MDETTNILTKSVIQTIQTDDYEMLNDETDHKMCGDLKLISIPSGTTESTDNGNNNIDDEYYRQS